MKYRKEIDGLRAIAVIPVVLFHAGIQGFSGGYVGVDIFFVISGYLITTIVLEEKRQNRFSVIDFYERRARRILPALTVVLTLTTIAAYILLPAKLLQDYSQSLFSVAIFLSNIFFFLKSGYFDAVADEKPLLHTWSLAVEEQYYLFFPLMVMLFWPLGKKWLFSFITVAAIASLLLAQFMSSNNIIEANFYLIFSRAWELFFGAVVVFILSKERSIGRWQRETISLLGFMMIVYAVVYYDGKTPFPGFYTLVPVLGACLIIIFTNSDTMIGRILANKILVYVGLISYSLYLWHQPLFAFLRIKTLGEPSQYTFIAAIIAAVILAVISWRYIETPFRNKVIFTRITIFKYAGISISMFSGLGLIGSYYKGFDSRFVTTAYADSIQFSPKRKECHTKGEDYLKPTKACKYFGDNITWASFGDSHTVEPAYALAEKLQSNNQGLVHLSFSGCPPSLLFDVKQPAGCSKWIKESLGYLEKDKTIKNILLGFRYSYFLYGEQLDLYPKLPDINPSYLYINILQPLSAAEAREIYWKSFQEIIIRLRQADKNIYILYPIPELPIDIHKAVMPVTVFGGGTTVDLDKSTSVDYYKQRNKFIIAKLDSLKYDNNLHAIKPLKILCDENYCPAVKNGKALYFDDDHLSVSGADLLMKNINLE